MSTAIARATELLRGYSAFARELGVSGPTIHEWVSLRRPVPPVRCAQIERATAGQVTCEELRPDIRWHRIPDAEWPHPQGRPLIDVAVPQQAHAAEAAQVERVG